MISEFQIEAGRPCLRLETCQLPFEHSRFTLQNKCTCILHKIIDYTHDFHKTSNCLLTEIEGVD